MSIRLTWHDAVRSGTQSAPSGLQRVPNVFQIIDDLYSQAYCTADHIIDEEVDRTREAGSMTVVPSCRRHGMRLSRKQRGPRFVTTNFERSKATTAEGFAQDTSEYVPLYPASV